MDRLERLLIDGEQAQEVAQILQDSGLVHLLHLGAKGRVLVVVCDGEELLAVLAGGRLGGNLDDVVAVIGLHGANHANHNGRDALCLGLLGRGSRSRSEALRQSRIDRGVVGCGASAALAAQRRGRGKRSGAQRSHGNQSRHHLDILKLLLVQVGHHKLAHRASRRAREGGEIAVKRINLVQDAAHVIQADAPPEPANSNELIEEPLHGILLVIHVCEELGEARAMIASLIRRSPNIFNHRLHIRRLVESGIPLVQNIVPAIHAVRAIRAPEQHFK